MDVVKVSREGAVLTWTVDRPAQLNAINMDVIDGLDIAISAAEADTSVRCVILRGGGEKAFVAGADIAAMAELSAAEAHRFATRGQAVLDRIAALPVPVIAVVHGFALGGGCELAMAADMIFAGPKAKFGQPEVKLGVIPGFGGTQRLVRRVGLPVALDLCLTGRIVNAEEALRIGLVSRVAEEPFAEAAAAAAQIAANGPTAVALCKAVLHQHADGDLKAGEAAERASFALCFASPEQKEGMSAFLEKRPAKF